MANSVSRPGTQPSGIFLHKLSGTRFEVKSAAAGMVQKLERAGLVGEHNVASVIGSGSHAFGFVVRVRDHLFQSPISYYSNLSTWDMAPGFEQDASPDFTRPVTAECLWCHAGRPLTMDRSLKRHQDPPAVGEAISCDRCHGATEAHLRQPSARNIVNPSKLSLPARDSVCEQCHLSGETRVANPGRRIGDFQAGQSLEEVFSVYVFAVPPATAQSRSIKVISHVEQLALSTCKKNSAGRMWCGSCHDPHDKPTEQITYYRERCLHCHRENLDNVHRSLKDCIGCHMPPRPSKDGGHTAFTDHRIVRRWAAESPSLSTRKLAAWREPEGLLARRNLGIAYASVGQRDGSAPYLAEGLRFLLEARPAYPDDPSLLTSLGLVLLRYGRTREAAQTFERVLQVEPDYAPYQVNAGLAWSELREYRKAVEHLERAIELDPGFEAAYRRLADIHRKNGQPDKVRETLDRYLKFMPQHIGALSARRGL